MFGGFGVTELLIILVIVLLLFGTKKLKNIGGDLGGAIKGFRKAVSTEEAKDEDPAEAKVIEGSSTETTSDKERDQQRNV